MCFVVGLIFGALSVAGSFGRFRLPRRLGGRGLALRRAGPMRALARGPRLGAKAPSGRGAQVSVFNGSSMMAFLSWFGGVGVLLTRLTAWRSVAIFGCAVAGGGVAATLVFLFLVKVLLARESELDPADFDPIGVLGRVNAPIREGGTGEILYSQAGGRRAAGARSDDGRAIPKGAEVVIVRCEKGIAYVQPFDEPAGAPEARQGFPERIRG
jgi:hypothetical protein